MRELALVVTCPTGEPGPAHEAEARAEAHRLGHTVTSLTLISVSDVEVNGLTIRCATYTTQVP